jgi:hypothetical protein
VAVDFDDYERRFGYIRARLRLLMPDEGGRHSGVFDDYRPNWGIVKQPSGELLMSGAPITVEGSGRLELGETGLVRLHPLFRETWDAWEGVESGALLTMLEGRRIVGIAVVLEIIRR